MRDNIPGFSIMEEPDRLEKLTGIAGTCYPHEGYTNPFFITMKKLALRHPEILEHSNLVYKVGNAVLNVHQNMLELLKKRHGIPVHNSLQHTHIEGRDLISGTFRDWYELAEFAKVINGGHPLQAGSFYAVNQDAGHILDEFLDNHAWPPPHDMELTDTNILTPYERMIHERVTVKFRVSLSTAHALLKIREASIADVVIPQTAMEPMFLSECSKELPCDVYGKLYVLWDEMTRQSAKAYEQIREVKSSIDKNLYGSGAFDILDDEASVVTGSAAVDLFMTMSLLHWDNVLERLTKENVAYSIREVMCPLKEELAGRYTFLFNKEA